MIALSPTRNLYLMSRSHDVAAAWRKSSRSTQEGQCVEVADLGDVAFRDSKNPAGPVLYFSSADWLRFVTAVKTDEHDL